MALEDEARLQGTTMAEVLDRITKQWLEMRKQQSGDDESEQSRLHAAAAKCFGTIAAGPNFSENVSAKVRMRLKERHAHKRSA